MQPLFSDMGMNVVYRAILECGEDYAKESKIDLRGGYPHYAWLDETPIASLATEIVDKIRELGYEIVKKDASQCP